MSGVKSFILINFVVYFGVVICDTQLFSDTAGSLNQFAVEFAQAAFNNEKGNVICSPFSTAMVLMMMAYGARESTLKQLESALHVNLNSEHLSENNVQSLLQSLEGLSEVHFRLANKIYVSEKVNLNPTFKSNLKSAFHSEVESVDFANKFGVADTVNKWCAAQTEGRIQNVVNPESFSPFTKLMLINTLYFRGEWNTEFDQEDEGYFYSKSGNPEPVTLMGRTGQIKYGAFESIPATFVELSYKSVNYTDSTSMYIILPNKDKELADVDLTKVTLNKLFKTQTRLVQLFLPKFVVKSTMNLEKPLEQLGLGSLFESNTDFSGMSENDRLKVDSILQQSYLDVNEKGSEAASVTVGGLDDRFGSSPEDQNLIDFRVDRPFYLIIANEYVITFVARVTNPKLAH